MSKKSSRQSAPISGTGHNKEITRLLGGAARRHHLSTVWADWLEACAIALSMADLKRAAAREARYREIMKRYDDAERTAFAHAFAHLQMAYEERFAFDDNDKLHIDFADILGDLYMTQELGNAASGQFFTPYHVSRLMAMMQVGDAQALGKQIQEQGYVTVMEPACGAGGMIIAMAEAIHEAGCNYQRGMHVTAIDVDTRCVHMTFIQMALLHIPGIVVHGNSLTFQFWDEWATPAHILGGWAWRLRRPSAPAAPAAEPVPAVDGGDALPAEPAEPVEPRSAVPDDDLQDDVDDQDETPDRVFAEAAR